jgi:O-acetyl-ADP-ribose deacetylase (regulator of RNase III)
MGKVVLIEGDITAQEVDAVVNAANSELILGSGVAGAIREKGGSAIAAECAAHGPIDVGDAAVTTAGDLPARYVIHAAGISLGGTAESRDVRSSIRASLALASGLGCRVVALPAIGTGVGALGLQACAEISLEEARLHLRGKTSLEEIRFVLQGEPAYRIFEMVDDSAKVAAQMQRLSKLS